LQLLESELVIDVVEPVVDYARSLSMFVADTAGELDAVLAELRRRVDTVIRTDGAFRVRTAGGCFVCR
jgi:hypothetical protein